MTGRGRPLRFLGLVLVGWIGVRAVMLWPGKGVADVVQPAAPQVAMPVLVPVAGEAAAMTPQPDIVPGRRMARQAILSGSAPAIDTRPGSLPPSVAMTGQAQAPPRSTPEPEAPRSIPLLPLAVESAGRRWSGSAWLLLRPGDGLGTAPGGQLGGGQAGVRVARRFDHGLAAFGRLSAPLAGRGAEGAMGVEWQPGRAPVRLALEHRFGVDGAPGGTGIGAIAGVDAELGRGFRLESYGQAGVILRRQRDPYADGAARVTRELVSQNGMALRLGGGVWGAAQREASRLDVGPSAVLSVPVRGRHLRVSLDWRQRIAGDARPGSGAALSLGSDF